MKTLIFDKPVALVVWWRDTAEEAIANRPTVATVAERLAGVDPVPTNYIMAFLSGLVRNVPEKLLSARRGHNGTTDMDKRGEPSP